MDENLKREIIIDNYQNPFNKKEIDDKTFIKVNTNNESCIDNIDLYVKIEENTIKDMYFSGEACAITTSATSIMIRSMINKTIDEVVELIDNYTNMIDEKEYNKDLLGELNCYDTVYRQPNRKKCAMLPFESIKKALNIYKR